MWGSVHTSRGERDFHSFESHGLPNLPSAVVMRALRWLCPFPRPASGGKSGWSDCCAAVRAVSPTHTHTFLMHAHLRRHYQHRYGSISDRAGVRPQSALSWNRPRPPTDVGEWGPVVHRYILCLPSAAHTYVRCSHTSYPHILAPAHASRRHLAKLTQKLT